MAKGVISVRTGVGAEGVETEVVAGIRAGVKQLKKKQGWERME